MSADVIVVSLVLTMNQFACISIVTILELGQVIATWHQNKISLMESCDTDFILILWTYFVSFLPILYIGLLFLQNIKISDSAHLVVIDEYVIHFFGNYMK